jgi:hypothetical protein
MSFEKAKKSLISIKLISYIIINILKLRSLYSSIESTSIIDKAILIKDFTKLGLDIISFNVVSIMLNSLSYYGKLKKLKNYISEKLKNFRYVKNNE